MGHAISMLTFPAEMKRDRIQAECDMWANDTYDRREDGGRCGGLGSKINFKDRLFDDYDAAYEYLEGTTGDYRQLQRPLKTLTDALQNIASVSTL